MDRSKKPGPDNSRADHIPGVLRIGAITVPDGDCQEREAAERTLDRRRPGRTIKRPGGRRTAHQTDRPDEPQPAPDPEPERHPSPPDRGPTNTPGEPVSPARRPGAGGVRRGRTRSPTTSSSRRRRRGRSGRGRTGRRRPCPARRSSWRSGSGRPARATAWRTVLTLPLWAAGITTCLRTESRRAVTLHSRTRTRMVTHHQTSPTIESATNAMPVSALSAIGSAILPKLVTRLRAAGDVAVDLVGDHRQREQRERDAAPAGSSRRRRASSAQPKNGTITMRSVVRALGTFQLPGARLLPSRSSRHARSPIGSATRSTPSVAMTSARTRSPTRVPSGRSPAWWCRRPRDPGGRPGPPPPPSVQRLHQHLDALADPLLGALGVELLDQRGDVLDPCPDLVLVELAVEAAASVPSSSE